MSKSNAEYCSAYRQRLKMRALRIYSDLFGPCCQNKECEETDISKLQFAHLEPTGLQGPSRGLTNRYLDVLKNPNKYTLLCVDCHREFDKKKIEEVPF